MYEQIDPVGSRIQTGSGFFCNSDVKKIPNAIPLGTSFSSRVSLRIRRNEPEWHLGNSDGRERWAAGAFLILPILCLILFATWFLCTHGAL